MLTLGIQRAIATSQEWDGGSGGVQARARRCGMLAAMLGWLHRWLRRRPAPAAAPAVLRALPAVRRSGRRRISTTVGEFEAHLARRRP